MKKTFVALALSLIGAGQPAIALSVDEVVAGLRAEGYSRVEVKMGPTQMKVEAIRGMQKLEIVYDRTTGAVLKTEVELVRPGENTTAGVSIRDRASNFAQPGRVRLHDGVSDGHEQRRRRGRDDFGAVDSGRDQSGSRHDHAED